uniref:Methyltransferase FkbM domain-containing protein n=1 Tax=viral metagenome TaxID=1070528 RepID=A0A6C0JL80_9ZZZZ
MTTKYFILTNPDEEITNIDDQQLYFINNKKTFILPYNNINYYSQNGLFESNLIQWAKTVFGNSGKNFIDIGAHTGTYSISLSDVYNHVYSFEPQKSTYYALCGSVALSNISNMTCYQTGLGSPEQVGKLSLKIISNDGGGSSLHANSNILREEEIEVRTLDSFNIENIGFIKMDVEDNELYVLHGAVETLEKNNYPPILFESNGNNEELFGYLKTTLGYRITKITGYSNMFLASS